MIDTTLCKGENCPESLRMNCHRFNAAPDPQWQSYFVESPIEAKSEDKNGDLLVSHKCDYFMKSKKVHHAGHKRRDHE